MVITIIILIILATVTINAAFGKNGLIEKAKLAKKLAENSTVAEQEGMNSLLGEYENIMGTPGEGGGSGTDSSIEELQNTIKDLNNQIEELKKKEAIGDATEADVVSGKTFSSSLGTGLIGAMPTYASGSTAITTAGRWGFDTTYGPWAYIPNDGYYKKAHWLNIPWNTVKGNLGDAAASNVLSGKTFTSSNGVKIGGSMPNRGQLNWSGSNTTYSVPAGYYSGGTIDSRPSYNAGYNAGKANYTKATGTTTASSYDIWVNVNLGWQPRTIILYCSDMQALYAYSADLNKQLMCDRNGARLQSVFQITNTGFKWYATSHSNNATMNYIAIK